MYIDIHTHLAYSKIYPLEYLSGMISSPALDLDPSKMKSLFQIFLNDKSCMRLKKSLEEAKIDKAVLLIIDGGIGLKQPELTIEEIHQLHYEALKAFPDKLIVFAGIDPRRGNKGLDLFKKSLNEYGFKGLKLYPPMGYAMDDPNLNEYYKLCNERGFPVLIHTGPSLPTLQNHFAEPRYIEKVAKKYSNIPFILAHAGYKLNNIEIQGLLEIPNVHADISGFQSFDLSKNMDVKLSLDLMFSEKYNKKILFGSDWPLFNLLAPLKNHVQQIEDLFNKSVSTDQLLLENILFRNSQKVLGID